MLYILCVLAGFFFITMQLLGALRPWVLVPYKYFTIITITIDIKWSNIPTIAKDHVPDHPYLIS